MSSCGTVAFNHVGLSVENLPASIEFYRDLFGMTLIEEQGFAGAKYEQILALPSVRGRVALLKRGTFQLELFEFESPEPNRQASNRPVCDHGITHFCLEVGDLRAEYERLKAAGVVFHSGPIAFPGAAIATYARDPDGNVIELLELEPT